MKPITEAKQTDQMQLRLNIEHDLDLITDILKSYKEDDHKNIISSLMNEVFRKANPSLYYSNFEQPPNYVENYIRNGLEFAIKKHKGQLRDSRIPYVTHPIQCGYLIAKFGLGKKVIVSAFLHDSLEENKDTVIEDFDEINIRFGEEVGEYIFSMSIFEDGEDKDENHINNIWFASQTLDNYVRFHLFSVDGMTNLYTKKDMKQKNGLTASERIRIFEKRAEKNLLPVAERIDRLGIIELNQASYIRELIRR